jgi:hypothetical protein
LPADVVVRFAYESSGLKVDRQATYYTDGKVIIEDRRRGAQWEIAGQPADVAKLQALLVKQGIFTVAKAEFSVPCTTCLTYRLTVRGDTKERTIRIDTPPWMMVSQLPRELGALRSSIAQMQMAADSTIIANAPGVVTPATATPIPPRLTFGAAQSAGDLDVAAAAPLALAEITGKLALQPKNGRFLVVPLRVSNRSGEPQQLAAGTTFVEGLSDKLGQRYAANIVAGSQYADAHGMASLAFYRLAPRETTTGILVFDVPADASGFRLVVRDADTADSNPPAVTLSLAAVSH